MPKGYLFYVIGSSGVGKDSILNEVKKKLFIDDQFIFAKRFITRPNKDGNETHIELSIPDFNHRIDQKLFALYWEAHTNFYGIGIEIEYWLANGYHVIVNGSRAYKDIAALNYPNLKSILIDADKEVIYERLVERKRESQQLIDQRMQRNEKFDRMQFDHIIKNDSTIKEAVDSFLLYINSLVAIKL
jgi:ribose 1,5-bisphosphokinase